MPSHPLARECDLRVGCDGDLGQSLCCFDLALICALGNQRQQRLNQTGDYEYI